MKIKQRLLPIIKLGNKEFIMNLANVIGIIICIYLPSSQNSVNYGADHLVFVWAVLIVVVLLISWCNRIKTKQLALSMFGLNAYMLFVTALGGEIFGNARISIARFVPIISLLVLCSLRIKNYPSLKLMKLLLSIVSITIAIWNVLILLKVQFVLDFSWNNYAQYGPLTVYYQIIVGHKPVMPFGVHTYAPYFYFLLFLLCFATFREEGNKVYFFYALLYTTFCLFCKSSTSTIYFAIMFLFLIHHFCKSLTLQKFIFIFGIIFFVLLLIYSNFSELYETLYINFTGGNNSFISRYSSESVFKTNFEIITSSLGIGYNIMDNLDISYSDSGYVLYMTMGNLPFAATIYYLLYKFLKENLSYYQTIILLVVFSFEVALPATFSYRFSYMILFIICYLGSLKMNSNNSVL